MRITFAGLTDTGRVRARNEDALLQRPERGLIAVADGMGGHAAGDVASRIAIDVLDDSTADGRIDTGVLEDAIREAHHAILKAARADAALEGMGTTLTALHVEADGGACAIGHVGDSRAYRVRDGALAQLTRDQTWVQERVDAGTLTRAQARNHPFAAMLTCALGVDEKPLDVQTLEVDARPGDLYLLCSDGLVARLDDDDIHGILGQHQDLDRLARALIDAANDAGGPDNITVGLARIA